MSATYIFALFICSLIFSLSILIWAIIFIWEQGTKKRRNNNLGVCMLWGSSSWWFWSLRLLAGSPAYWLRFCSCNGQDGDLAITLSCRWNINNNFREHGLSLSPSPGCKCMEKSRQLCWQGSYCHPVWVQGTQMEQWRCLLFIWIFSFRLNFFLG